MYSYLNSSDVDADKSSKRDSDGILNVDSSEVKNSINYSPSLNYGINTKDNYLNKIKKKANYPWDIKSTLENLYPVDNKKVNNKTIKKESYLSNKDFFRELESVEKRYDNRNKITRGALDIIKEYSVTRPIARTYEKVMDFKELREVAFPFKSINHMRAALDIGKGIDIDGSDNLSSTSDRFALEYDNLYKNNKLKGKIEEGRNALRHTLWQGALSSKYGPKVARDAGDSHETRPYIDVSIRDFDKYTDADMVTDLLNNKIGRRIGAMYPGSSRKELALRVLEEYWRNGLYSYEQGRDGRWYVQKKRIPDNVFYDLYNKYKKLNNFGR